MMIVSMSFICFSMSMSVGLGVGHKGAVVVDVPVGRVGQPVQRFQKQHANGALVTSADVLVAGPLSWQFKEQSPHRQHSSRSTELIGVGTAVAPEVGQSHSPRKQQYGYAIVFVGCEMGTGNTTPLLVVLVIGKPGSNIGIVTVPLTMLDIGVVGQDFGFLLDAVVKVNWVILALKTEVEGE
jgi:hypothetical protein